MGTQVKRSEALALLLMASAWGWNGGNFSQPNLDLGTQVFITMLHYVPVALIVGLGTLLLTRPVAWLRIAISTVAAIGVIALAIIVVIGISNPNPNSFGPHNFADYVPVALIAIGIATWFASQMRGSSVDSPDYRPSGHPKVGDSRD
ncbi:MAG TPA: hypothetical protein VHO95_11860 [Candidatus Dormibacteraeota bacterium]|jgi:hypothetical protein|nr:hypothetical protein [Candidatus Dormibacteraeota bacterium]HEX2682087.1 hypothetical protein [Candidatus Dormibacteraeota bacterium]